MSSVFFFSVLHVFACLFGLGPRAREQLPKAMGFSEVSSRTMAIETSMKSSAFGFLLAKLHFGSFEARVPSAISVVWMAITGSMMAIIWRYIPVETPKFDRGVKDRFEKVSALCCCLFGERARLFVVVVPRLFRREFKPVGSLGHRPPFSREKPFDFLSSTNAAALCHLLPFALRRARKWSQINFVSVLRRRFGKDKDGKAKST